MNFDHRSPELGRHLDLRRRGPDEQRNADAGVLKLVHHGRELRALPDDIEPALGGAFGALFRHQAHRMRPRLECNADHFLGRRHLKIQRLVDLRFQARNIIVADVAAIFPQVRGDAVAACGNCKLGGAHRVGMTPAAGIADGGYVVDVDAETEKMQVVGGTSRSPAPPSPPPVWRATAQEWRSNA